MYEAFYGFTEKPFSLQPDPAFLYLGKKHRMALTMLEYGLANQSPITVVTGEVGSGKTTLIRHLLNAMHSDITVGMITNTHKSLGGLLQWVAMAFDLEYRGRPNVELYDEFVQFLVAEYGKGKRTVLIVDEAQNMDRDTLEELRMLSNVNAEKDQVLQLVLVGQPELRATLNRAELRQFVQRVTASYHLEPLSRDETKSYIQHRVRVARGPEGLFGEDACDAIWYYSRGIPRLINTICDTALVYAYADDLQWISSDLIHQVAKDRRRGGLGLHHEILGSSSDPESDSAT